MKLLVILIAFKLVQCLTLSSNEVALEQGSQGFESETPVLEEEDGLGTEDPGEDTNLSVRALFTFFPGHFSQPCTQDVFGNCGRQNITQPNSQVFNRKTYLTEIRKKMKQKQETTTAATTTVPEITTTAITSTTSSTTTTTTINTKTTTTSTSRTTMIPITIILRTRYFSRPIEEIPASEVREEIDEDRIRFPD